MSNAYVFETHCEDQHEIEMMAIGHTSGAVQIYKMLDIGLILGVNLKSTWIELMN